MNLKEILKKHEMWLNDEEGGERANLYNTNLSYVNLSDANLREANLSGADLSYVNLSGANLEGVNLSGADLKYADLKYANLSSADLVFTNLRGACLKGANLSYANLKNANLTGTCLMDADLNNIKTNIYTIGYNLACPEKGSFIGYKKSNGYIIELLIPEDAKRFSATTAKCRCDKAKVLDIEDINTGEKIKEVSSNYDPNFIYRVGEMVTVDDFDDDRWNECAPGIHFFMNRENAINY